MQKTISWFEIPVLDLDRARAFYERVLGITMQVGDMGPLRLAIFPHDRENATGGCLQWGPGAVPARDGVIVYLNAGDNLAPALDRVAPAGGSIAVPKTELAGVGVWAQIIDTEGNRVGLFALK